MSMAMDAVEDISRKQADGRVILHPRRPFRTSRWWRLLSLHGRHGHRSRLLAMKQYTYVKGILRVLVPLYEISTGDLLALIEADFMASNAPARFRRRHKISCPPETHEPPPSSAREARQEPNSKPSPPRESSIPPAFTAATPTAAQTSAPKCPTASASRYHPASSAARSCPRRRHRQHRNHIRQPVLDGHDIAEGAHVNAIGANHAHKRELDDTAISRAGVIFVDSIEQSKQEAGDLIVPFQQQPPKWDAVRELDQLVAGKVPGRTSESKSLLLQIKRHRLLGSLESPKRSMPSPDKKNSVGNCRFFLQESNR